MTQKTWLPRPLLNALFPDFGKIESFPENFLNVFRIKMANCIFEELSNLFIINCFANHFLSSSFVDSIKTEPSWRNYLFELQNQAEHNTTNKQTNKQTNCTWLFISNCNNASDIFISSHPEVILPPSPPPVGFPLITRER